MQIKQEGRAVRREGQGRYSSDWGRSWVEVATELCRVDARFSDWLDRCFDDVICLDYGKTSKSSFRKDLSYLQEQIYKKEIWREIGGLFKIFKQEDMLAIMRKLESATNPQNLLSTKGEEVQGAKVRILRYDTEFRRSPQRRGHQKQCAKQLTNTLPFLSYEGALEVTKIWDHLSLAYSSNVSLPVELDGFKCTKAQHRAHQLKAYGNAIVPQVAIEIFNFIKQ